MRGEVEVQDAGFVCQYLGFPVVSTIVKGSGFKFLPISTKCVANQTLALLSIKASAMAKAIATPSLVLVPRPSSSMMARL